MQRHLNLSYLNLRFKWFKLKAKEFTQRYAAGLVVILLLLPGVAVGDNLRIFLTTLTQPLILVTELNQPFLVQLGCVVILLVIFLVWSIAQKNAIDGGPFNTYLNAFNTEVKKIKRTDFLMILIANHFLWLFIVFGFSYFLFSNEHTLENLIRYVLLVGMLMSAQHISIFTPAQKKTKKLSVVFFLLVMLIVPLAYEVEWLRLFTLLIIMLGCWLFTPGSKTPTVAITVPKKAFQFLLIKPNFYLQMLFKASLASTCFRILLMSIFIAGFASGANHFKANNNANLVPYAYLMAALLSFYLSGFYLLFRDQRLSIEQMLKPLPIPLFYWFKRDFLALVLISLLLHVPYYMALQNHFNAAVMFKAWSFHSVLLLISYPLRMYAKEPTFSTFIINLVLVIIFMYNFT